MPAVALLAAVAVSTIKILLSNYKSFLLRKGIPVLITLIAILYSVFAERAYLFEFSPNQISRMAYGGNPFTESVEIADYIKQHTSQDDSIAILGSEAQILFYANRLSATGYIFTYQLIEPHSYALQMQQEMIREIEVASPKFIIFVRVRGSWLVRPDSEDMIFKWFQQYQQKYYKLVGVIDMISSGQTIYHWDQNGVTYSPQSKSVIFVLKRKNDHQSPLSG